MGRDVSCKSGYPLGPTPWGTPSRPAGPAGGHFDSISGKARDEVSGRVRQIAVTARGSPGLDDSTRRGKTATQIAATRRPRLAPARTCPPERHRRFSVPKSAVRPARPGLARLHLSPRAGGAPGVRGPSEALARPRLASMSTSASQARLGGTYKHPALPHHHHRASLGERLIESHAAPRGRPLTAKRDSQSHRAGGACLQALGRVRLPISPRSLPARSHAAWPCE